MNIIATIHDHGYTFNFYTDNECVECAKDDEKRKIVNLGVTTDSCSGDFIGCPRCPLNGACRDTPVATMLARFKPDVLTSYPEYFLQELL